MMSLFNKLVIEASEIFLLFDRFTIRSVKQNATVIRKKRTISEGHTFGISARAAEE